MSVRDGDQEWTALREELEALHAQIAEAPDLATAADLYHEAISLEARAVALRASDCREWLSARREITQ